MHAAGTSEAECLLLQDFQKLSSALTSLNPNLIVFTSGTSETDSLMLQKFLKTVLNPSLTLLYSHGICSSDP